MESSSFERKGNALFEGMVPKQREPETDGTTQLLKRLSR
jgi:hypothetical protein